MPLRAQPCPVLPEEGGWSACLDMGTRGIRSGRSIRVTGFIVVAGWRGRRRRLAGAAKPWRGDAGSCDDAAAHQPSEGDEEAGPEAAERWQQRREHGRL